MSELNSILQPILAVTSLFALIVTIGGAFKAGVLKKIKFGTFEVEACGQDVSLKGTQIKEFINTSSDEIPYEAEQLANYYTQILSQSRISFWFSLIFASLGFTVILGSVMLYNGEKVGTTVVSFVAGTIIDAISALFFVQSKSAQKAMGEFFDKLRRDRQQLEARKICEIISNPDAKDSVRIQIALHLAEVQDGKEIAGTIIGQCFSR